MKKVNVSQRAIEARVRRALEKEDKLLRKCRTDSRFHSELGDYYIVDANSSLIQAQHCDIEVLAKELGLLKGWEVISD